MNLEQAAQTIAKRGFTDRQARFLVLVARHSGVCVMRQYSSFAGIVFGQKTRKLFANLVQLGFVSTYDCAHNRGRVYHVRHRAIYEAIGEPDTVGDYFAMLRDELAGLPINKSERNLRLRRLLQNRSKGSVEFKHANISAVLTLHGYPYVDGYKPRFNFQALLEQVVLEYLDVHRDFFEPLVTGPVLNPTTSPDPGALDMDRLVELPPEAMRIPQTVWSPTTRLSRFDFVARDAANRDLGRRGEEFVLEFERKRLHDGGRRDLVQRIEWTAQARGDGAGYDLQSFNADGSTRLIEVKTTGLGKYFPFNVTLNEVRCSEARPGEFQLYRVFNFGPGARLYMLPGAISGSCHLDATQYRAFVQSTGP